jgi:hypothetical protein
MGRLPLPWVGLVVTLAILAQQAITMMQGDATSYATSIWQVGVMALGQPKSSARTLPGGQILTPEPFHVGRLITFGRSKGTRSCASRILRR